MLSKAPFFIRLVPIFGATVQKPHPKKQENPVFMRVFGPLFPLIATVLQSDAAVFPL